MRVEIFTLCDFAADKDGQFTIVSTFDTLYPPSIPYQHPLCFIAVRIRTDSGEIGKHPFKLIFKSPDGVEVSRKEGFANVAKSDEYSGTSHVAIVQYNLPFPALGRYSLVLFIDEKELASLPLLVRKHPSLR